jgi:DNA-directed RNA polymerase specialized sigma24 family protein
MEVLEKILVRLIRYQAGRACFNTWMFAVAKNYRRDQLRRLAKGQDPLENALPEDVLGWIWASGVNKDVTEAAVQQQIDTAINPPVITPQLPWQN